MLLCCMVVVCVNVIQVVLFYPCRIKSIQVTKRTFALGEKVTFFLHFFLASVIIPVHVLRNVSKAWTT